MKRSIHRMIVYGIPILALYLVLSGSGTAAGPFAQQHPPHKAGTAPQAGLKSLDPQGEMQISEADRCPVCAMKVMNYPKFSCAIQLTDATTYYFCATGCLLRAWLHPQVFLNVDGRNIKRIVVRDYFSGQQIDALTATWIAGSDVIGPMGPALVPLKDEKLVEAFKRRHGGLRVFRMQQLNDEMWQELTGKSAAP